MAKASQVLEIDPPNEITFRGPFTEVVTSQLKLSNPSDRQVCFKVKTTAPKQYCVRPNSGFVPPKGSVVVAVMLQPLDAGTEQLGKHKFMVQSAYTIEGETSLDNVWRNTPGHELMDSKLRVVFEMPDQPTAALASEVKQSPQKPLNIESVAQSGGDWKASMLTQENGRLKEKLQELEDENLTLRKKLKSAEASSHSSGGAQVAFAPELKMLHVVIVGIVAVFLGLLLGKIF